MTESHSSSVIENSIRSRRMPALLTSTSSPPNVSMAWATGALAPSKGPMSSVFAAASPPAALISSTTCCAGPASSPLPSRAAPRSLTTTFAPCALSMSACSRPMPRPAPVTMHTRPSTIRCSIALLSPSCCGSWRLDRGREHAGHRLVQRGLVHGTAVEVRVGPAPLEQRDRREGELERIRRAAPSEGGERDAELTAQRQVPLHAGTADLLVLL